MKAAREMILESIARPRVERALRERVERTPLTLLRAPLGAGKSIAASMAFAGRPGTVWMHARPWHRGAFAGGIVEAVRGVRPEFGRTTLGAIEAGAPAAHTGARFAQELTHVDEPLLVILDDAHVLSGDPEFAQFFEAAVEALPDSVRMLVLGRTIPDLALGQSFARGRAALLEGDLLAFDASEIAALAAHRGIDLDDGARTAIAEATLGWATGVALAVTPNQISMTAGTGPRGIAEAYLAERLLPALTPQAVDFLERTSVFETLEPRVLERGRAFAGARALLGAMRDAGALLTELESGGYRVHPLLRELAFERLSARGAAGDAHRDAALAYMDAGETAAALFHTQACADPHAAAAFLRRFAGDAVATGNHARARAVAARIDAAGPDAYVRSFTEGLIEKSRGSDDARACFERAAVAADGAGDAAIAFEARAQLVEHDIARAATIDGTALALLESHARSLGERERAAAAVLLGWSRAVAGDFRQARAAADPFVGAHDARIRFNAGILHAYAQTALGEIDGAQATLDTLVRSLENDDRVVLQTLALVWFARLALAWGHTNAASDAAAHAERLAAALDLRAEEAALYLTLLEIASHRGETARIVAYAERARSRAARAWYAADVDRIAAFADIALARAAFLGHDNAIARDLALRAASLPATPSAQKAVALSEAAVYALLCAPAQASPTIARAHAAVADAVPADAADAVAISVAADVLAFLDAANGEANAVRLPACEPFAALLEQRRGVVTLELAGVAAGNARRGTGSPVAFETAIEALTRDGPRFEARLARAYTATFIRPAREPERSAPALDLTPRELEILGLLVDGLTNKEIAQRLTLSPRTIETHVERVLAKLDVGSRSRAIAKALRLGIVSLA